MGMARAAAKGHPLLLEDRGEFGAAHNMRQPAAPPLRASRFTGIPSTVDVWGYWSAAVIPGLRVSEEPGTHEQGAVPVVIMLALASTS